MSEETWMLVRAGDAIELRSASNEPGLSIDLSVTVRPGVETFGVPYEAWARLRSGSVVVKVEDGRRVAVSLPPEGPPPGPWPVRKVREEPKP